MRFPDRNTLQKAIKIYFFVSVITVLIFLPDVVFFLKNGVYNYAVSGFVVVQLLALMPVVLFYYNLRIYYLIAALICSIIPLALLPVLLINSQVNAEMAGLLLDTNYKEATELLGWRVFVVAAMIVLNFLLVIWLGRRLPKKLNFKTAALISGLAILGFLAIPFLRSRDIKKHPIILKNTFRTYYPFRMVNIFSYLYSEMQNTRNYQKVVKNFSYGAYRKTEDSLRHIHILIIGEASRFDHWAINGYARETSPNLDSMKNLVSFSNVASGGTMTILSVPQLITRADALNFDLHKKEKSILEAFKEVGYKTFWISNQSKFGLTGNIGMHYNDGDTAIFNGYGDNESNFRGNYDSALVDIVKNVMDQYSKKDIFMIVHTIGSHYRYLLRYPESFTHFRPVSDRNRMSLSYPSRDIVINEYDNSILYTDLIISQIIDEVKATGAESTVTFVSDHGENLGDDDRKLYFHSYTPTHYTAQVPLFIWGSDLFLKKNADKFSFLRQHKDRKISSADNVFHTILDMAGIGIKNSDSTRSIASPYFTDSRQEVLGENGKVTPFDEIK